MRCWGVFLDWGRGGCIFFCMTFKEKKKLYISISMRTKSKAELLKVCPMNAGGSFPLSDSPFLFLAISLSFLSEPCKCKDDSDFVFVSGNCKLKTTTTKKGQKSGFGSFSL